MARPTPRSLALAATLGGAALLLAGSSSGQRPPAASVAAPPVSSPELARAAVVQAVAELAERTKELGGTLGVSVVDARTGERIAAHRDDTPMNPASNAKVVTAWAALRKLGPDHRYQTGLYGRLDGQGEVERLVVRGDGDPSLELRHLYELASSAVRDGLTRVGDIVVDQGHFDLDHVPPAFGQQPGEWAAFRAPVAAVSLGRNTVTLEVRAAPREGEAARIAVVPDGYVTVRGRVRTAPAGEPDAVRVALEPSGDRLTAELGGSIPLRSPTVRIYRRVDDPGPLVGYGLRAVLRELGVEVTGRVEVAATSEKRLLSLHTSAPLAQLLPMLGKNSNNFYAEMVFKSLSTTTGGSPASFARSASVLEALLDAAAVPRVGVVMKNGSGLFDANRLTARATTDVLVAGYRDPAVRPELIAQLAIAGVDGTLRHRLLRWGARRAIRAKTGTLAAVSSLSGYVLGPPGGTTVAYAVFLNGVGGKSIEARRHIDKLADRIGEAVWASTTTSP